MKDTAIAIALLIWLVLVAPTVGILSVLRPLHLSTVSRLESAVFAAALGVGLVSYLILALGVLHGARTPVFVVLLVAGLLSVAASARIRRFWSGGADDARRVVTPDRDWVCVAAMVLIVPLACATLIAALAPPGLMDWDALSYHLAAVKVYLAHGRIFYLPYDHHSNFPFTLEMWFLFMLGLGSVGAAKLCHWFCWALLVASMLPFAARYASQGAKRVGWMGALLVAGTPILLWEASIAYSDLATALFTWLSVYAMLNALRAGDRPDRSWVIVSALLMGFALGSKMTVLGFLAMTLIGMAGPEIARTRTLSPDRLRLCLFWTIISVAVGLPWYVKSYLFAGSPVYPFFYNLFGGHYWSAHNAALYAADQGRFGLGKTFLNLLLAPWQVVTEQTLAPSVGRPFVFTEYSIYGFVLSPALLALTLGAPLLYGEKRPPMASVALAWFSCGVLVFWFFLMQQTRYLIPAVPAVAFIGADALDAARQQGRRVVSALGGLLAFAAATDGLWQVSAELTVRALPVVTGQQIATDYVAQYGPDRLGVAEQWIDGNTPTGAKVALFDEVRGFYLDRDYAWATPNHAYGLFPWDTYVGADDWLADFKRRGYTTLLVNEKNAPATDDGQRWRGLLAEAVAGNKVSLVFAVPNSRPGPDGSQSFVKVYRIP